MPNVMQLLPEVDPEEMVFLQNVLRDFSDQQASLFAMMYRSRRRDPQTVLLVTLLGFIGFAGLQRFLTDQIGMGILYLFTAGICFVGTIIDLVNHKKLAFEYNQLQAQQLATLVRTTYTS